MKKLFSLLIAITILFTAFCYAASGDNKTYEDGYRDGVNDGYDEGYNDGYSDGKSDAKSAGKTSSYTTGTNGGSTNGAVAAVGMTSPKTGASVPTLPILAVAVVAGIIVCGRKAAKN